MSGLIGAGVKGDHVDPFGNIIPDLGEALGCPLLPGATAYFGFDPCKEPYTNYFLCTGTADHGPINDALTYVDGLGGGDVKGEDGAYDVTEIINYRKTPLDPSKMWGWTQNSKPSKEDFLCPM